MAAGARWLGICLVCLFQVRGHLGSSSASTGDNDCDFDHGTSPENACWRCPAVCCCRWRPKVDSGVKETCLPEVGSGEKGRVEGKLAGQ